MNTIITLSVDKTLIQQAQQQAANENTTLEALFQEWLAHYVAHTWFHEYQALIARLNHVEAGQHFSREEMNERR